MMFLKTALSVSAIVMFVATASFAQGEYPKPNAGEEATGMPASLSHPTAQTAEIQTTEINNPVGVAAVSPISFGAPVYTVRTPLETMAADPAAAAVLNRDLPGLLTDPSYAIFKTMSLKQLQQASGGDLSVVDVNKTVADLQTLPPR
jgi:hypothetical protein